MLKLCILFIKISFFSHFPSFQLLPKELIQLRVFPNMLALVLIIPKPTETSQGGGFLKSSCLTVECSTWLAGSEAAFYPDNKTYIQTPIPRVAFISSHTAALTPGHLAVLLSIDVKWPEVPPGMGRARSHHNRHDQRGVSLRTWLSLILSLPYSLQWSSTGTLIPTPKRIVLSLFLIKV